MARRIAKKRSIVKRLAKKAPKKPAKRAAKKKRAPAKKKRAPAKKAPAKKAPAKKAPVKKAPAKKAPAKKAPAKKKRAPAKKKRAPAKKAPAKKKRAPASDVRRPAKKRGPPILPKSWRKLPAYVFQQRDLERMAAQVAQRIAEKIGGGGHAPDSIEAKILLALIAAEQMGTLNREYYAQAGEYEGYDTPQEVYELWIYSGD